MKKRNGRLERQQNDGWVEGLFAITEYDETEFESSYRDVYEEVEEADDENELVVMCRLVCEDGKEPRMKMCFYFKDDEAPEMTEAEERGIDYLIWGYIAFFRTHDEMPMPDTVYDVATATEKTFELEPDFILGSIASLFKKGFKVRLVVPVPHEKYVRHLAEFEAIEAS